MKKHIIKFLLIYISCFSLFVSCDEENDKGVHFANYDEFMTNKTAWINAEKSVMNYKLTSESFGSIGFKTTVTSETSDENQVEITDAAEEYKNIESWKNSNYGIFYTPKDIYDFIERDYESLKKNYSNSDIDIVVEYETIRGLKYPKRYEVTEWVDAGYSGSLAYSIIVNSYSEE